MFNMDYNERILTAIADLDSQEVPNYEKGADAVRTAKLYLELKQPNFDKHSPRPK